jgi:hypothetical protein
VTEPKTPQDVAALGFAYAGFMLSATLLHAAVARGEITADDARKIISDARKALGHPETFPGDPRARQFADMALGQAETLLGLAAARKPTAGPN